MSIDEFMKEIKKYSGHFIKICENGPRIRDILRQECPICFLARKKGGSYKNFQDAGTFLDMKWFDVRNIAMAADYNADGDAVVQDRLLRALDFPVKAVTSYI